MKKTPGRTRFTKLVEALYGRFGLQDLVAALFGAGSMLARIVYSLVGLSALWQLVPLSAAFGSDEPANMLP